MDKENENLIEEERAKLLKELKTAENGSEKEKKLLDALQRLTNMSVMQAKIEIDDGRTSAQNETGFKQQELDERRLTLDEQRLELDKQRQAQEEKKLELETQKLELDKQKEAQESLVKEREEESKKKERRNDLIKSIVGWGVQIIGFAVSIALAVNNNKFTEEFGDKILSFEKDGEYPSSASWKWFTSRRK